MRVLEAQYVLPFKAATFVRTKAVVLRTTCTKILNQISKPAAKVAPATQRTVGRLARPTPQCESSIDAAAHTIDYAMHRNA